MTRTVPELAEKLRVTYWSRPVQAGTPFASTRQIAMRFKVSTLTANRAINLLVQDGYLYRKSRSGTFFSQSRKPCYRIGMAMSPSYPEIGRQKGFEQAIAFLREAGVELKFIYYGELSDPVRGALEIQNLDGLMLSGDLLDEMTLKHIESFRGKVVLMNLDYRHPLGFSQVISDFEPGFQEILPYIGKDQKIMVVHGQHLNGMARRDCFLQMLQKQGFSAEEVALVSFSGESNENGQMKFYQYFLENAESIRERFVFCTSDITSNICLKALMYRGLVPGKDFDWISCDHQARYGYEISGVEHLTTVECFRMETLAESAKLMLRILENPSEYETTVYIPTKLIAGSTAALKKDGGRI